MKRLLFLDVDGVLNNSKSNLDLYPYALLLLSNVVAKTKCEIVLSSTWRLYPSSCEQLEDAFKNHRIPKWIGSTPYFLNRPRSDEILMWLEENITVPVNVVVVDDEKDAKLPNNLESIKANFVHTDYTNGFTENHALEVVSFFELYPM